MLDAHLISAESADSLTLSPLWKVVNDIRKTLSGAILDPEDKIKDVLDDNDFVSIVLETDRPNPSLEQAEVYIREVIRTICTFVRCVMSLHKFLVESSLCLRNICLWTVSLSILIIL